jgi:hypothetical protein
MMSNSNDVKARAEASFKRKEEQARQATKAWIEYEAQRRAVAEKTERLRASIGERGSCIRCGQRAAVNIAAFKMSWGGGYGIV